MTAHDKSAAYKSLVSFTGLAAVAPEARLSFSSIAWLWTVVLAIVPTMKQAAISASSMAW
jgi:hypothetical protein